MWPKFAEGKYINGHWRGGPHLPSANVFRILRRTHKLEQSLAQ